MGDESEVNKKAGGLQAMGRDQPIFEGIVKMSYEQPTHIQRKTTPPILDGKDLVAMSRTGSGNTAAFVIPMLQRLKKRDTKEVRALLLSPTRELALQTFKVVNEFGRFTGLRCACLLGGDSLDEQFSAIHEKPDILLATPGRILHIVVEMELKLNEVKFVVFDEADRHFEMVYAEQLHDLLKRVPGGRQALVFSATLSIILVDFAKVGLSDPTLVRLDLDTKLSNKLKMLFVICRVSNKLDALLFLCRWEVADVQAKQQTIVFSATMKHVQYVASILKETGLGYAFLYSHLERTAWKRNIARDCKFKNFVSADGPTPVKKIRTDFRPRFRGEDRGEQLGSSRGRESSQPRNELKNADKIMKQHRDRANKANHQAHQQEDNPGRRQFGCIPARRGNSRSERSNESTSERSNERSSGRSNESSSERNKESNNESSPESNESSDRIDIMLLPPLSLGPLPRKMDCKEQRAFARYREHLRAQDADPVQVLLDIGYEYSEFLFFDTLVRRIIVRMSLEQLATCIRWPRFSNDIKEPLRSRFEDFCTENVKDVDDFRKFRASALYSLFTDEAKLRMVDRIFET